MPGITLTRRQARLVGSVIERWRNDGIISPETASRLAESYTVSAFDWRRLSMLSILIACLSLIIAAASVLEDTALMALLARLLDWPEELRLFGLSAVAAALFWWGARRRRTRPDSFYSNEGIMFLGVVATANAIAYFGMIVGGDSGHFSLLLLLGHVIYVAVALVSRSKLIWVFALLSLGAWLGAETGYVSGWGAYFLGMNFPLRFVLFGAGLIALAHLLQADQRLAWLFQSTMTMGMLWLFLALWIMSIFGNYGDIDTWYRAPKAELFAWAVVFAAAAFAAIGYGLKFDNTVARGFGITFLFINLYTRFFEYFWDGLHKAIFFAILGLSLWLIGSHAQKIWNLGRAREVAEG